MRARRMPIRIRRIDARKLQRRVTDVDLGVRQQADRFQCGAGSLMAPVWGRWRWRASCLSGALPRGGTVQRIPPGLRRNALHFPAYV